MRAVYGGNCGADEYFTGHVTARLGDACNGKSACSYLITLASVLKLHSRVTGAE